MLDKAIDLIPLLLKLGFAVYQAVREGNRTLTVGEIFDGTPLDEDELDRLDAIAAEALEK